MSVRIKPVNTIKIRLGINPDGKVQKFLVNAAYKRMDKYVPYSGATKRYHLRENVTLTSNSITYEMPYAHAQYVGYTTGEIKNYTTPGTGTYWDKKMMSAEKADLVKDVQKFVDGGK